MRARPLIRTLLALACAALALPLTGSPTAARPGQAGQAEPDESGSTGEADSAGQPEGAPAIELVEQTSWVRPGENLDLTLQLTGTTPDVTPNLTLALDIHNPLESRNAFTATLEGEQLGGQADRWGPEPVTTLLPDADAEGNIRVSYPVPDDGSGSALSGDGAYPVEIHLADTSGTTLDTIVTYMLLLPSESEGFPPLSVATVVEVGAPPALQPSGAISLGDDSLERFEQRTSGLREAQDVPLTVAPVPETLDALATSGDDARVSALQVALASREVLGRPYVDLDLDAIADAMLVTEVPPVVDEGARVIRTRFGREPLGRIWLTGPTLGQGAIDAMRQLGVERAVVPQSAVTDIPEDAQTEGPAPTSLVTLTEGGPQALVVDEALSSRLAGTDGRLDAQRFLAELMTIWQTRPGVPRAVTVRIPKDVDVDPDLLADALTGLNDGAAVQATTLGRTFDLLAMQAATEGDEPPVVQLSPHTPSDDLSDLSTPLHEAQTEVFGLATALDDTALITSLGHSVLLALGSEVPGEERRAYLTRTQELLRQVGAEVHAPDGFTMTLTAREGTIPLTITNASDRTVTVKVRLQSNQLEFPEGTELNLEVPPGQVREDIPVRTRVSGAAALDVQVTSPDGSLVISEATFTIRSTAVSGVGLVLSVGAGLFLLIWWARHWRSARRSRRLVETDPHGTPKVTVPPGPPGPPRPPGPPGPPGPPPFPQAPQVPQFPHHGR